MNELSLKFKLENKNSETNWMEEIMKEKQEISETYKCWSLEKVCNRG